jgi:hypothetical protein
MLPEVKEYFDAQTDSDGAYENAKYETERAYPVPRWNVTWGAAERQTYYEAQEARDAALWQLKRDKRERQAAAHQALMALDDKLVHWLMTDTVITRSYGSHRDVVLRHLPLSREEINDFGGNQGWCGEYRDLLNRAEAAGVLPEPTPEFADVEELVREIQRNIGGSNAGVSRMVRKHLPGILASAQVKAAEAKRNGTVHPLVQIEATA